MSAAAIPANEDQRIAALKRYDILDTLPESNYDDLTLLASQICQSPISLVSLLDSNRQWFKSHHGIELEESPRSLSFCAHAIHDEGVFEVPDATLDERFFDNALVTGEQHVRFYAGAPLITPDGLKLGTLCVIDRESRALSDEQRVSLAALARQVVALLELRRNVAQLEANNRELKQSREEFESFMNNSPIVAFIKDREGRMVYANKFWEKVFDWKIGEVLGRTDFDYLPFDVATALRKNDLLALKENRVIQTIEQVPTPSNPACEWLVFKFPMSAGARLGGVALDLTELRRAEKLKDEFIAVVSHELRTPLTALRGSLSLLHNRVAGELPPHAHEMVRMALKNAERLSCLINDLLDMEKIETGAMKFEMGAIDLEKLLESALELNDSYAAPLDVRLQLEPFPPELRELREVRVWGDFDRLMQVLTNLISNAAKFTPPSGSVRVRVRRIENCVRIEVCDEGKGVPPEFVSRLFERFAQADASATRRRGGTGLGLAISRAIIAKHGTQIGYQAPDENRAGSTFFFELYLAEFIESNGIAVQ